MENFLANKGFNSDNMALEINAVNRPIWEKIAKLQRSAF
jgi:hypothetical protein